MTIPVTLVNVGNSPNDNTGDPAQVAFAKINQSLTSLSSAGGGSIAVSSPDATLAITVNGSNLALSAGPLNMIPGTFSYAGLPAASANANKAAMTTDKQLVVSNGSFWAVQFNPTQGVLAISTNTPVPTAQNGTAYSLQLTVTGAVGGVTWSRADGFTYTNVWAVSASGLLTGTPTVNTTDTLVIQVTDSTGAPAQKIITLQTVAALTPAATPTFSPVAGNYSTSQSVTISDSTPSSTIYYTTNGSTPTTGSTVYTTPITVAVNTTIKAIATAAGFTQSAVGSAAYTIGGVAAANPVGIYLPSGGANTYSFEGLPLFQDQFRSGRYTNQFTGSLATTGVLTVTALTVPTSNNIPLGGYILEVNGAAILNQLTGTPGGIGTYQTSVTGTVLGFQTFNMSQFPITVDANGWPNTDFSFLLYEGARALSWLTTGGNGKFFCGFLSKNAGAETITALSGCTITDTGTAGGIHTFDLAYTSGNVSFKVTGTTGGVTNIFCRLPAYRAGGYVATGLGVTQFTTEAIAEYSNYGHIRDMEPANAWNDCGETRTFTTILSAGATSATLSVPFPYTTGTYRVLFWYYSFANGHDVRSLTLTNGSTAVSWTGALTKTCFAIIIQNSSQNRRTPTNTKTSLGWGQSEGFPKEWHLDLCAACGIPAYCNAPLNDDGTWQSAVATLVTTTYSIVKTKWEIGNEIWGQSGANMIMFDMATFLGLTNNVYYAQTYHTFAATMRTAYGGNFAANCDIWMCWQQGAGNGLDWFYNTFAYYDTQSWVPSADIKVIAMAPYYNTTNTGLTASIDISGVLHVTGGLTGNPGKRALAPNAVVTGTSVPANSLITSQLTGPAGGTGTYQLSTPGTVVASEAMNAVMANTSTIAQLQANLTVSASVASAATALENLYAMAANRGLKTGTYEGGLQANSENSGMTNGGASQLDSGFTAIENGHLQPIFNAGVSYYTATCGGVNATISNWSPGNELSIVFPPSNANSPKRAALLNFTGGATPTKNVVSAVGSVIQGYNWVDNLDSTLLGNFAFGSFTTAPYYHTAGYVAYIINVTTAGSYNIDVTFSSVSGSPTTSVQVDATILATLVAVANGVKRVAASVSLPKGTHLLLLGQSGAQGTSAQNLITQIQFN